MTSLRNPPSRLSLGLTLLTEIQAPSVGLCYVIGTLATRSKKSSIIFVLSINPLFFPPTGPSPLLYGSHTIIFLRTKVYLNHLISRQSSLQFLCKPRPSISAALQAVSLRLSLNAWYQSPLLLPLTMCEHYLWPTQYIFINEF